MAVGVLSELEFVVAGQTLKHNEVRWSVKTNRHTTTKGNDWGWIEGAEGNVTWSDDRSDRFNGAAAREAAKLHNQWLDDIQPLSIKLIKAERAQEAAASAHRDACTKATETHKALRDATAVLQDLLSQQAVA